MKNAFFSIYINYFDSNSSLISKMHMYFDGICKGDELYSDFIDATVVDNDDYDMQKSFQFPDGFLSFRKLLEVDYEISNEEYVIIKLNEFITYLWNSEIPAVVSSDFEYKLMNNGGYNNLGLPFPHN